LKNVLETYLKNLRFKIFQIQDFRAAGRGLTVEGIGCVVQPSTGLHSKFWHCKPRQEKDFLNPGAIKKAIGSRWLFNAT
jgi:hypothetical protein